MTWQVICIRARDVMDLAALASELVRMTAKSVRLVLGLTIAAICAISVLMDSILQTVAVIYAVLTARLAITTFNA